MKAQELPMNPTQLPSSRFAVAIFLLAAMTVAGCASAPPPVHSMQDATADFSAFTTYAWERPQDTAQPISLLDNQIRTAISGELQRKGYAEAGAGATPDLMLQYETAAAEAIKSKPFRIGIGVGGHGSSGGAGVGVSSAAAENVREGTLVLRVIDRARNAEVWNGRVSRELSKTGPPDPDLIQAAAGALLQKFPSRRGDLAPAQPR
jgi:hypothetical protein